MTMHRWKEKGWSPLTTLAVLTALAGAAGCGGGRASVSGRVTYEDGSPLTAGNVIGQTGEGAASTTVQGSVKSDGTFSWGTDRPGDGAKPGKYRVAVQTRALGDEERSKGMQPAIDDKYTRFETSQIEFTVKEGSNDLQIKVTKPKPAKGG